MRTRYKLGRVKTAPEIRVWRYLVPSCGCWIWGGTIQKRDGYGVFATKPGKQVKAHRYVYELFGNKIPSGAHLLHRCDNRKCVNPDHMFIGTNRENTADRVAKGRSAHGVKSAKAKLTPDAVTEIRRLLAAGESMSSVARLFGVTAQSIFLIKRGDTWKSVPCGV